MTAASADGSRTAGQEVSAASRISDESAVPLLRDMQLGNAGPITANPLAAGRQDSSAAAVMVDLDIGAPRFGLIRVRRPLCQGAPEFVPGTSGRFPERAAGGESVQVAPCRRRVLRSRNTAAARSRAYHSGTCPGGCGCSTSARSASLRRLRQRAPAAAVVPLSAA